MLFRRFRRLIDTPFGAMYRELGWDFHPYFLSFRPAVAGLLP